MAQKPDLDSGSPREIKARIRAGLLLERDIQLQKPSVRRFVHGMERRQLGPNGWTSIFSLMRDGSELAKRLEDAASVPRGYEREQILRTVIDPYIQVVDDSTCEETSLELKAIWRYFRHTWAIPHQTVPGRNIWFLIRDRAVQNHPVIGIAALGSAIVQMRERDKWVGWDRKTFLAELRSNPSDSWASWVEASLAELFQGIYIEDFLRDGLLKEKDFSNPRAETITRLMQLGEKEREAHRLYPRAAEHKAPPSGTDWEKRACTHLFRSKRAKTLASLLAAKRKLLSTGFDAARSDTLGQCLDEQNGRDAVAEILRRVKASHVGIDIMDITVCGAVAPYNAILGGKLISLLMTSPEVASAYEKRYEDAASIIASSMAGRPIVRDPQLVLLGTTSLYGVGSSQYNRLRLPTSRVGGTGDEEIRYHYLSHTTGYGSYHFSATTLNEMGKLLAQDGDARRVNSIFGEGVNPRLRKVRDALDLVGFASDEVLQHGNRRIIYGIPLASNFREVLLGLDDQAKRFLPADNPEEVTGKVVDFWIRRWLSRRIENDEILSQVARHTLLYPISHGARVQLPAVTEEQTLFSE